ncbi:ATP-binding cassette domain-containing protein [Miltoncostaea marina]|uniref:ATP-binding cassette domain-containing protein n=1 Tax=Miltoncostaea marina TaxID=2843215 RepID=UPI001C3CBAD7|nr:ATP-binding cassette domain-containing protein [Miltoncostaea marina]
MADGGLAIETRGLEKRFGEVRALRGVDLAVPAGTVLGLLGPNGAGKTTAVRILATVLDRDGGSARVLGVDVAERPDLVRRRIGLAGQFAAVDGNLTGRENLLLIGLLAHLPRREVGPRADELLERFGLAGAAGRTVRTYSGGMRRRLDLAAALVHRPPVLFLDEPTTGLDPASRSDLWDTVRELVAEGTTVLLTTQYLEEADLLAHRIVVIDHGRVVVEGSSSELKRRLGATVVELTMADEAAAAAAEPALARLGTGEAAREGAVVRVSAPDGGPALVAAVRALDALGLEPREAAVREPSLDDVFLRLTGHRAEEPPAGEAA